MCNFSTGIFEEGRAEGRAEGRIEGRAEGRAEGRMEGRTEGLEEALLGSIRAVMGSLRCSAEKAMDILKLPAESRKMLLEKL